VKVVNSYITGFSAGKFTGVTGEVYGWEGWETGPNPANPQPYLWCDMNAGVQGGQLGAFVIENSLIAGNLQGIAADVQYGATTQITNVTVADNQLAGIVTMPRGGGGVMVDSSIVWGNGYQAIFPTTGYYGDAGGPPWGVDFSELMAACGTFQLDNVDFETSGDLIGWGGGAPLGPPGGAGGFDVQGQAATGLGNIAANPLFVGGGGPDGYLLSAGSPCIDAGGVMSAEVLDMWNTYAGGDARLIGAAVDMGADEVPEPATMALLGIGGVLALIRRRRR